MPNGLRPRPAVAAAATGSSTHESGSGHGGTPRTHTRTHTHTCCWLLRQLPLPAAGCRLPLLLRRPPLLLRRLPLLLRYCCRAAVTAAALAPDSQGEDLLAWHRVWRLLVKVTHHRRWFAQAPVCRRPSGRRAILQLRRAHRSHPWLVTRHGQRLRFICYNPAHQWRPEAVQGWGPLGNTHHQTHTVASDGSCIA
jgi:hypothetical protein